MANLKINSAAPAFSLVNQDAQKVSLKDYKGKKNVILYLVLELI